MTVLLVPAAIPILIWLCVAYVSLEHPAYLWDYGAYWESFRGVGEQICSGSDRWQSAVLNSIRNDDYNPAGVVPLSPFYCLYGGARDVYLIAISLLYVLPLALVTAWLALSCSGLRGPAAFATAFVLALTYLPFWAPTVRGMVDVSGALFLALATLVLFKSDFLRRRPIPFAILLGLLVWMPFLLRRWYAFSIVIFFVSALVVGAWVRWNAPGRNRSFLTLVIALSISGLVAAGLVLAFQSGLARRALSTSYAEIYAAYQIGFIDHLTWALDRLGWYIVIVMAIGALRSLFDRSATAVFCLVTAAGTFLFFIQTQAMGPHHFLPVALWLFPLYFLGLSWIAGQLLFLPAAIRLAPAVVAGVAIFAYSLFPFTGVPPTIRSVFLPKNNAWPLHLDNYSEYRRFVSDLDGLMRNKERFAVFASSGYLSDSLLTALEPLLKDNIVYFPHLASIELFRADLLSVDYAVASEPPQTHMAPGSQDHVVITNAMLLDGKAFGAAFERKPASYKLAGGVTAYIFERRRPVTAAVVTELYDALVARYPKWQATVRSSMAVPFALREAVLGDVWGTVNVVDDHTLFVHPGQNSPTSVSLPVGKGGGKPAAVHLSIKRSVLDSCPNADGVAVTVNVGSEVVWSGDVAPGASERVALPPADQVVTLVVGKRAQAYCDHLHAKFEIREGGP